MSLILEALKKSEANRRLGEVPDLATPFATSPPRRSPLPILIGLIIVASVAGWWYLRTPPAAGDAATAAPAAQRTAAKPAPIAAQPPAAVATAAQSSVPAAAGSTPPATSAQQNQNPAGGGFVAMPKPWNPNAPKRNADGKAMTAQAQQPAAQPAPALAASKPAAPPTPAAAVVASGAGQQKADATTPASAVASGSGQKKHEAAAPAPMAPAVKAGAAPATPSMIASGVGQKKPEVAAAPAPSAPSVVASGSGQKKGDAGADANAASAAPSAPPYNELTFATRKDLPALRLSMHVYAEDPLQRFVILNNARMLEGDTQENLSVREIRPDGVVLEFRGQRFFFPRDGL